MKNICIFTGARPNFIKVAPLIRAIERTENCQYQLVYAGTADDPTLEPSLFSDLQIQRPDVFLGVDCENLNELTGRVMAEFERYLEQHETDTVNHGCRYCYQEAWPSLGPSGGWHALVRYLDA